MFTLQKFIMPQANICLQEKMFFRVNKEEDIDYNFEDHTYSFKKNGELFSNTYFNSFCSPKWYRYTVIDEIIVSLRLKGNFEISLVKSFLADNEIINNTVKQLYSSSEEKKTITFKYNFSLDQFDGFYYLKLKALENDSIFYGGEILTDKAPINQIKMGAVICTFKRENFIYKNLDLFKRDILKNQNSQLKEQLDLFVIDNAGTLDHKYFDHKQLHLIKNKNVGGAGGFTRGIIEVLESALPYTHVLLMDDDALLDINSLERTYAFLSYTKKQHSDLYIGGATLRLDKQNIQLESGAVWNNNLLFNIKQNLDLTSVADILFNDLEESRSYNAWVFSCIPLESLSPSNLPLPLFVRGDDMEFGIRNSKKILTMNGICAWHAPLHNKYSSFMTYYTLRNQLVLNALYDKNFSSSSAIKLLAQNLTRELLYYRYENIDLIIKAYTDFLGGVSFFIDTDGEQLHKDIMKFAPHFQDFNELSRGDNPFMYVKLAVSQNQRDSKKWKRFVRRLTFNGYLLPESLFKKGGWDNYGIVELTSARAINFFRRKKVLQVDLVSNRGYLTEISKKKFFSTWIRFFKLSFYIRMGGYKKAVKSYQNEINKISNITFWKEYLDLERK